MKKRSSPDSPSCTSSSSSSANSVPDQQVPRKNRRQPRLQMKNTATRSSIYRGVTRHRWTGRFEAHLWDKSCWNNIRNKKGRQVYLGAYDSEEAAAHTYDLAALKHWGPETTLNYPVETYENELEEMKRVSKEEFLASLRRRSNGFSRGASKYRGVARHHQNGRWEARIGQVFGHKYLYLGTYDTQEEAAAAYDRAAIEHRGPNAVTNFDISNYLDPLKKKCLHIAPPQDTTFETESEQQPRIQDKDREPNQEPHYPQLMSWCSDAGGLAPLPLPLPDLSLELPDPGFEVDIDLIFNTTDCNWPF